MKLLEGEDFYYNEAGLMVLTDQYLKKRGYCCKNHCLHCPYGYSNRVQPMPAALQRKMSEDEDPDKAM